MPKSTKKKNIDNNLFINRELGSLEFNKRVLEEAYDPSNPLLERARFVSIVSANLDEFTMVRVAAVWDQVLADLGETDEAGFTPRQLLEELSQRMHAMMDDLYSCFERSLKPALKRENLIMARLKKLSPKQREFTKNLFLKTIYPVLTPMVVDKSRPFPLLSNRSLNIGLLLEDEMQSKEPVFATVQVPAVLDRLVELKAEDGKRTFMLLEEIIKEQMEQLFTGHRIITMGCYRITRNAGLGVDEEGAEDLLEAIQQSLKMRKWGEVIRLEVEQGMDERLLGLLAEELEVPETGIFKIRGPIDLTFLNRLSNLPGYNHLRFPILRPQMPPAFDKEEDCFKLIADKNILVHHPYQSFDPVVNLVNQASQDPDTLAIKQILYRVSGNSPIVEALARAAENGKQVTVLVEIKARFDEEQNINWAKQLEKAGCHVIYGLVGLKTHTKILLIVRREETGIKRYLHLSTGNYNDVTARAYEDLGFFTSDPYLGSDASALFNMLSGLSNLGPLYKIHVAPHGLRLKFIQLIQNEAKNAQAGKKAHIIAKMNSLIDRELIEELYIASQAGVKIELIVRGICCLRPGIKGVSENIRVRSIVGRFLEHSRIYYFYNDGEETLYLSSADWMPRNLDRRVEIIFPIEENSLRLRILDLLQAYLKDTVKARLLLPDGNYVRVNRRGKTLFNAQEYLLSTGL
ncbi:MAG: RNA degradosome polyphosphate kinase [Syntrophomonadaceae bacterium]|nr:RNA degradosome polyphosphate kinase [Syntrophomonadaceae bacterium]